MREFIKLTGILTFISLLAAGALANVYRVTRDKIAAVEEAKEESARRAVLPDAAVFRPDSTADGFVFYRGWPDSSSTGEAVGMVTLTLGKGYSSTLRTVVGVDREMKITGIRVASQQETPGLGTRVEEVKRGATEPWFQAQFRGKTDNQLVVVHQADPEKIEAITGATISSRAVTGSVREALEKLKKVKP